MFVEVAPRMVHCLLNVPHPCLACVCYEDDATEVARDVSDVLSSFVVCVIIQSGITFPSELSESLGVFIARDCGVVGLYALLAIVFSSLSLCVD